MCIGPDTQQYAVAVAQGRLCSHYQGGFAVTISKTDIHRAGAVAVRS